MLTLPASVRVFVARGATDLRRSFDRLSAQVQEVLRQDPLSGHVFVFFNRQRNRVKLLVWERDGFWLLYKRLEAGTFAALERDEINARELYLLLEGIEVVRERMKVPAGRFPEHRDQRRLCEPRDLTHGRDPALTELARGRGPDAP